MASVCSGLLVNLALKAFETHLTSLSRFVAAHVHFFFSSRRRHTRFDCDWSSDVCSSDLQYYAQQVRKAEYALDETQLEPYFELDRVLKDGVFFAANRLYGLTFKQRTDLQIGRASCRERV